MVRRALSYGVSDESYLPISQKRVQFFVNILSCMVYRVQMHQPECSTCQVKVKVYVMASNADIGLAGRCFPTIACYAAPVNVLKRKFKF